MNIFKFPYNKTAKKVFSLVIFGCGIVRRQQSSILFISHFFFFGKNKFFTNGSCKAAIFVEFLFWFLFIKILDFHHEIVNKFSLEFLGQKQKMKIFTNVVNF